MDPFDTYDIDVEVAEDFPQDEDAELNEERDDAEQLISMDQLEEEIDQPENVASYRERQQATAGSRPGADTFAPLGGNLARAQRTPEEIARIQIDQTFNNPEMSFLNEGERTNIRDRLIDFPNIQFYNVETLVKAAAYLERNKDLNRKSFQAYSNQISAAGVYQIDLVRYIRLLMTPPKRS